MRNNYEMAEVLELGSSRQQILGSKPMVMNEFDSVFGLNRSTETWPDDIDESDD